MLHHQLIQNNFPTLHLKDKVSFALTLLDEYDIQHLPVVEDENFVGIVCKADLLDADENVKIEVLQQHFIVSHVKADSFFTEALAQMAEKELSIVAVTNSQQQYVGIITSQKIVEATNTFLNTEEKGAILVLEIDKRNYSFGEISRLIETNNAYITQLNTFLNTENGYTTVTLKLNTLEVSDVVATLQRYDYRILYYFGEEDYNNEIKENYTHLMAYLNI